VGCSLRERRKSYLTAALAAVALAAAAPSLAVTLPNTETTTRSEHQGPINVTGAETIYDSRADTFTVRGNAVMTQGGSVLKADQIEVLRRQREAIATGHVHLIDPDVEIWARRAKVNLAEETLELDDAKVKARASNYHLEGSKIRKLRGQNYQVINGFFTTCGCEKGAPDWAITADQMDVQLGGTGTLHGGAFDVLGHQLFKVPVADFPADTNRHSGFLSGREGQSGLRGFQWVQPFYLAIDKSQDATAALDVETSQRVGGLVEYRLTNGIDDYFWADAGYFNETIRSDANRQSDIIDDQIADPFIPSSRWDLIAMMRQHITPSLTLFGSSMYQSDDLLFRELDIWTLSRGFGNNFGSVRSGTSDLGLLDEFNNGYARLDGSFNQDYIQNQDFALQRLPELTISGRQNLLGGLAYADYDAEGDYFFRHQGRDGWRFSIDPRVTVPWRLGDYLYGYGTVGTLANLYDTAGQPIGVIPVGTKNLEYNNGLVLQPTGRDGLQGSGVPYARLGAATELEHVYNLNWQSISKLKHTIEPFVSYAYVPRIYEGNLPLFDQLDRLDSRSLLTYGLTMRLYARMVGEQSPEEENSAGAAGPSGESTTYGNPQPAQATGGPISQASEPSESLAPPSATTFSRGQGVRRLAQLTVMESYDLSHVITPGGGNNSDIESILSLYPTTIFSLGSQLDYNPRSNAGITFANAYFNFQPPWSEINPNMYMGKALQGSFLQLSYNYVNRQFAVIPGTVGNASQFITGRAYTDLFQRLGVYFAPSYDVAASKLLSAEYGVRLKSPCDCWALDMGLTNSYNPNEVQVQFQLTLGGLGSVGNSPFGRNPFQRTGLAGQPTGVLPNY
jgi:LPS-assembly protein